MIGILQDKFQPPDVFIGQTVFFQVNIIESQEKKLSCSGDGDLAAVLWCKQKHMVFAIVECAAIDALCARTG